MKSGMIIGSQIIVMFIILAVGILCYKIKLIDKKGTKQLSNIALNVVNPALIFMSYQKKYSSEMAKGLMWAFLLSVVAYVVMIALSFLLVGKNNPDKGLERFTCVYSNCGFIGIPLINGIFGSEGVLYLTAFVTMFNLLVWTHGLMTMKEEIDFSSFVKAVKSPSVIAVFSGLICYFGRITVPEIIGNAVNYVGDMNTPLAMLIAGATCAQTSFPEALKNKRNYLICLYRLLVFPAAAFGVCLLFHAPAMVLTTITIAAACPAAATGTMFAIQLDKKPERCSELFALTTIFSAVTLPVITILAGKIV